MDSCEELFEINCISLWLKVHLYDAEQVEEKSDVEDCVLFVDVVFEGEQGSCHFEAKLVVDKTNLSSAWKEVSLKNIVNSLELFLVG